MDVKRYSYIKISLLLLILSNLITINRSKRCTRLPEENMTATELIRYNGFPAEVHAVQTMDGYILTMHRIPYGRNTTLKSYLKSKAKRQVVFLQHGLAASSTNWITNLPNESLAFVLADQGYDVWMGNVRGNKYSKRHVKLSPNQSAFWDFSWEEMAEYDLPAMINYALNRTNQKRLIYLGHSQGTLIAFAKLSTDYNLARKIKTFIALAPVSTVQYVTSPVKYLAPFTWSIQKALELFGDRSLGDLTWILNYVKPACDLVPVTEMLCENIIFYIAGAESKAMLNQTRIPVYLAHNPDDTSMKNIVHFGQMVNSGRMQKFDYGYIKNLAIYGQLSPPEYHPEFMETETITFWSPKDALADKDDVHKLLPKIKHLRSYRIDNFSHLDFLWSIEAYGCIYAKILNLLKEL